MRYFKFTAVITSVVLLLTLSFPAAFAAGDNNDEPLTLQSSSVVDGDTNISIHPVIELVFTGKMDDILVLPNNKDCFHLQNAAGEVKSLTVLFPDTQVQSAFRNHAFLVPEAELAPGETYTLTIDSRLQDKKDNLLGQTLQIQFTTATDETFARLKENDDLIKLGDNVLSYSTALAPAASSDAATDQSAEEAEQDNTSGGPSTQTIVGIAVPVLVILLALVFYSNWKKTRQQSDKTK